MLKWSGKKTVCLTFSAIQNGGKAVERNKRMNRRARLTTLGP